MRPIRGYTGLQCPDQLLRNDGYDRHLGLAPIAAVRPGGRKIDCLKSKPMKVRITPYSPLASLSIVVQDFFTITTPSGDFISQYDISNSSAVCDVPKADSRGQSFATLASRLNVDLVLAKKLDVV